MGDETKAAEEALPELKADQACIVCEQTLEQIKDQRVFSVIVTRTDPPAEDGGEPQKTQEHKVLCANCARAVYGMLDRAIALGQLLPAPDMTQQIISPAANLPAGAASSIPGPGGPGTGFIIPFPKNVKGGK